MPRAIRRALALTGALLCGTCFHGQALWGEPCVDAGDCGPELACHEDAVCADVRMCSEVDLELADLRPQVALLLDHSGSMNRCIDAPELAFECEGAPERWDALGDLVRVIVPEFAERLEFAAVVFPSDTFVSTDDPLGCVLDGSTNIPFGELDAADKILVAVRPSIEEPGPEQRTPKGENPVRLALSGLFETDPAAPVRARAIVLVTDNPPNCPARQYTPFDYAEKLDPDVVPLVQQYRADGVVTIVVAINVVDALAPIQVGDYKIDDTNPHAYFSALALAGGAAQDGPEPYLHLADAAAHDAVVAGLRERLDALTADHDACRVRLGATPDYPDLVAVEFDGRLLRADPDCAGEAAWRYVGDDHRVLQLCPAACERFRAGAPARIRLGCP